MVDAIALHSPAFTYTHPPIRPNHPTHPQAQEEAQASILVAALVRADTPDPADPSGATPLTSTCANATVWGNVLVRSPSARPGPLFQIHTAGLDPSSKLVMGHNVYYDQAALGKHAML